MLAEIFKSVVLMSAVGGMVSILLLCLMPVTRKVFSPRWQYYVWLTVLIVLLVPVRFSLPKHTPAMQQAEQAQTVPLGGAAANPEMTLPEERSRAVLSEPLPEALQTARPPQISLPQNAVRMMSIVWLIGAITALLVKLSKYLVFLRTIQKNSYRDDGISNLPKGLCLRRTDLLDAPLIVGLLKPVLYLPDVELSQDSFNYILRHELTHYKRHDLLYKWLAMFTMCVHWFNPLLYVVSRQIDLDCETSCDAAATKGLSEQEKNSYMNMILDMLLNAKSSLRPLTTQMASEKKIIKRRFEMMRNKKKTNKVAAVLSMIVAMVVLTATVFASGVLAGQFNGKAYSSWADTELGKAQKYGLIDIWYSFEDYQKEVTREEFCEIAEALCVQNGITLYANGHMEAQLTDVKQNQNPAAVNMYCMGIVPGKTDTLFAPNDPVTQEDAAVFLQNLFDYVHLGVFLGEYNAESTEYRFADDSEISETAKDSVYSMLQHNILRGDGSGRFYPMQNLTVEKCVILLTRLYEGINSCFENAEGLIYNQFQSIQLQADNGERPWRLDQYQTVREYAQSNNLGDGEITVTFNDGIRAVATYASGDHIYRVELFKPVRQDETGIWVVKGLGFLAGPTNETKPFSESEIAAARAVVEEYWRAKIAMDRDAILKTVTEYNRADNVVYFDEDEVITLDAIRCSPYDETREGYIQYGRGSVNGTKYEDVIVFRVDYTVAEAGHSAYHEGQYIDWSMILIRDGENGQWLIDDQGY